MATKGDQRRQRILAVVNDLVETCSYEEITIAEITRRAEVTRPGFYFYFPTKGAAVASLMENLYAQYTEAARIWYEHGGDDQAGAFREGMAATVALWRKHAHVMHAMVQAAASDTHAMEIWDRWVHAFAARAIPIIAADAESRIRRAGSSVEAVAQLLVDATFAAMRRDVRAVVEHGEGSADVENTVSLLWIQALYP